MWRFWQKHGHLAEARRRLEAMAAAPWSHDDPRLRAKLMEALGGICWWQADLPAMSAGATEKRWRSGRRSATKPSSPTPTTTRRSPTPSTSAIGPSDDPDPDEIGLRYLEKARDIFRRIGDRRGEANALWGIGNYQYFRNHPGNGDEEFREALTMFRRRRRSDDGGLGAAHARDALLRNGDVAEARGTSTTRSAISMPPATRRA